MAASNHFRVGQHGLNRLKSPMRGASPFILRHFRAKVLIGVGLIPNFDNKNFVQSYDTTGLVSPLSATFRPPYPLPNVCYHLSTHQTYARHGMPRGIAAVLP